MYSALINLSNDLKINIQVDESGNVTKAVKINAAGVESPLDSELKASNVKKDVVILGIKGTYTAS